MEDYYDEEIYMFRNEASISEDIIIMKLKNFENKEEVPFVIYEDFDSIF